MNTHGDIVVVDAPPPPNTYSQCRQAGWVKYGFASHADCITYVHDQARQKCILERVAHGITAFRAKYGLGPDTITRCATASGSTPASKAARLIPRVPGADTGRAMSQENVEIVRRVSDAYNRRDVGAMLDELHPEIEWHPWLQLQLGGGATVYRGHQGVRKGIRELEEAFSEIQAEQTEIRDLGERVVAIGHLRGRGNESGAITESAIAWIVEFKSGKVIRVREYLDPKKALEAAGLSE